MLGLRRAVAIAALLTLAVGAAQQPQTGAIAGTVADRSGGVLPGVVITLTGPSVAKGVTNARGEYRIDNLLPGEYRLEASLPGFRSGGATVTVSAGVTTKTDVGLRLGLLSTVHYIMPNGISGAVREADVIAHIRLTGNARPRLLNDSMIVTDHDSTVLAVVKADAPTIVSGGSLTFAQDNAGEWFEEGYRAKGVELPYRPGDSFLAFLKRNKDSSLGEGWGEWYMWPVKQGFVVIEPGSPLPAGLRSAMPVDEALNVLRKLQGGAGQAQTGVIAGTVTESSGGALPGVTIVATGPGQSRKVISDRKGAYRIDDLPPGLYRVQADLVGFRWAISESVAVTVRETTIHDIRMRLGIVSPDLYVIPPGGVLGALREASVVVHLEIVASLGSRLRHNESVIVTEHRSKVLAVVKADQAVIVVGGELTFDQEGAGEWTENGQRSTGLRRPYGAGSSFIAFLMRNPDGTLVEFRGEAFMFPVSKGFTTVRYAGGAAASGLRATMPVEECLAALRKILAGSLP